MRVERILNAGLSEVAERGLQEARKWLERSRQRAGLPPEDGLGLLSIEDTLRAFRDPQPSRFFAGALEAETARLVDATCPQAWAEALASVQRTAHGRFDLLGYRDLNFGAPIDWSLDPVSGQRAPLVYWSQLDPLDRAEVGDSKVIWELNRHQWLVPHAQAHAWTGDDVHAERLLQLLHSWRAANPPGMGINWASSLELSFRLISWCWCLYLIRGSPALRADHLHAVLASLRSHALHVERYLSHFFSPNTHLTGEALGLFYAGTAFPELREAPRWRSLGARILLEQAERQILSDGVHFEQSTCYQRYTAEIYLHFLILAARSGLAVPERLGATVERMLDFLLAVRRPDGTMPEIGDADGGSLLPLAVRAPGDLRGVFSTAAAWFHRDDFAWAAQGLAPETLWLLGREGQRAFDALHPTAPDTGPSTFFPAGGYAVFRDGWSSGGHQLIFDAGPLGCPISGAHGHADLLSLQCSVFGEPVLVDPGTFAYQSEGGLRDRFRGTAFHNTITVDGRGQAEPDGVFRWRQRPRAHLGAWSVSEKLELAEGWHDAFAHLADPVRHRRRILFFDRRCWVVVDDLDGAGEHRVELHFQFAPLAVGLEASDWIRAVTPGGHGLLLRSFSAEPLSNELGASAELGFVSPAYGQRIAAPHLVCSVTARMPVRIATVLVPIADSLAAPPSLRPSIEHGGLRRLVCDAALGELRLDPEHLEDAARPRA